MMVICGIDELNSGDLVTSNPGTNGTDGIIITALRRRHYLDS